MDPARPSKVAVAVPLALVTSVLALVGCEANTSSILKSGDAEQTSTSAPEHAPSALQRGLNAQNYSRSEDFARSLRDSDRSTDFTCLAVIGLKRAAWEHRHGRDDMEAALGARETAILTKLLETHQINASEIEFTAKRTADWLTSLPKEGERGSETVMGYVYRCIDAGLLGPDGD